jgi:hypothetical protein
MTNSPPDNVNIEDYKILTSGIDNLNLAIYVEWNNNIIFNYLDELKEKAKNSEHEEEGIFRTEDGSKEWKFNIKPHGVKGYSWILTSKDYTLKIGNWSDIRQRPSIMVEIRSETLLRMGVENAVIWILELIKGLGTNIINIKPSRFDPYVDMIIPAEMWSEKIMEYVVTRAREYDIHKKNFIFTGVTIGRGKLIARIYDKGLEVLTKSKKLYMFDVWGVDQIPPDKKIIRVEFQLRREIIKSLLLEKIIDLFELENHVWVYLTDWLKFQDRPGTHHTQRTTLDWWQKVQNGYKGCQGANPAIRAKAVRIDKARLSLQSLGTLNSIQAIVLEENGADENHQVELVDIIRTYLTEIGNVVNNMDEINNRIKKKRAKYHRTREKK